MKNDWFLVDEKEVPLERLVPDGGYSAIFRTVCCIGDSLSSGEFEIGNEDGTKSYHDIYEQSWGQYLARRTGAKVYNFSRGGLTAQEFLASYANEFDCYNPEKACQAYIIALGVNDLIGRIDSDAGCAEDFIKGNPETFAGQYGEIVRRYKAISPDAKFFFMTMPRDNRDERANARQEKHRELLLEAAKIFPNSYVLDFRTYAPVYDEKFKEVFYLHGHLSPMGYKLTADFVMSYLDYIIRHNPQDFKLAGMINTKNLLCTV